MAHIKTRRLFLGISVDNGTSTAVLGDEWGNPLVEMKGESINHLDLGMRRAKENLKCLIASTIGIESIGELESVFLTYESSQIRNVNHVSKLVQSVIRTPNVQLFGYHSSIVLGLRRKRCHMVVLSNSTGTVLGSDEDGMLLHLGSPSPSIAGGGIADISLRALLMSDEITKEFATDEVRDALLCGPTDLYSKKLCDFVLHINELAEQGNLVALELLISAADSLIRLVTDMVRRLGSRKPTIGILGGVILESMIVHDRFCQIVAALYPQTKIIVVTKAPAFGAYLLGLRSNRISDLP